MGRQPFWINEHPSNVFRLGRIGFFKVLLNFTRIYLPFLQFQLRSTRRKNNTIRRGLGNGTRIADRRWLLSIAPLLQLSWNFHETCQEPPKVPRTFINGIQPLQGQEHAMRCHEMPWGVECLTHVRPTRMALWDFWLERRDRLGNTIQCLLTSLLVGWFSPIEYTIVLALCRRRRNGQAPNLLRICLCDFRCVGVCSCQWCGSGHCCPI